MLQGMDFITVRRGFRAGFQNIVRESGWGTSLASLFGVLLLCQFLFLVMIGLEGGIRLLEEKTDLRLEILENASDAQIQDLFQNIRSLPIVEDVLYITKEQAMERMKARDPELLTFITTFGVENPFPETIGVRLKRLSDYEAFVQFIKQPVFSAVVNPQFLSTTTDQEEQVRKLLDATGTAHTIVFFIVGFLAIVLLFVVIELIRRRAISKRDELYIQQLVGASRTTILLPFFAEMLLLLLFACVLSVIVSALLLFLVPFVIPSFSATGTFGEWMVHSRGVLLPSIFPILFVEFFGIFLLAFLGTSFALKDQLLLLIHPRAA